MKLTFARGTYSLAGRHDNTGRTPGADFFT